MPGTDSDSAPCIPTHEFRWNNVTFKVGNRLFRVARQELVKESPVFESMFSLPNSDAAGKVEGQSDDNPISLDGYQPEDFEALLRLLYPTFDDLIKGSIDLTKSQWTGVLKLSTMWEMEKIRTHAILTLSTVSFNLTPVEKISLAREHRVGPWLEEGLVSLANGDPDLSLDDLEAAVGLRTAYRIVGIRAKNNAAAPRHKLGQRMVAGKPYPTLSLGSLVCTSCRASVFQIPFTCESCEEDVPSHEEGHVIILPSRTSELRAGGTPGLVYLSIDVKRLEHTGCRKSLLVYGCLYRGCYCDPSSSDGDTLHFLLQSSENTVTAIGTSVIRSTFADEFKEMGQ